MALSRRGFLRIAGLTGTAALGAASAARASSADGKGENEVAMLVDATLCAGCRGCEAACAEANALAPPEDEVDAAKARRETGPEAFTVVNGFAGAGARRGSLRQAAVHALHRSGLRVGVPGARARQAARRPRRLPRRAVHGLPLLHGGVPLRDPEVPVRPARAARARERE